MHFNNKQQFTAVYQKRKNWTIGWIEEIPGVNTQGKTLEEVKENLKEALALILKANREILNKELRNLKVTREPLVISL